MGLDREPRSLLALAPAARGSSPLGDSSRCDQGRADDASSLGYFGRLRAPRTRVKERET
jgi:hypothetical protein